MIIKDIVEFDYSDYHICNISSSNSHFQIKVKSITTNHKFYVKFTKNSKLYRSFWNKMRIVDRYETLSISYRDYHYDRVTLLGSDEDRILREKYAEFLI